MDDATLTAHERYLLEFLNDGDRHGCNESGSNFPAYRRLVALGLAKEVGWYALDFDAGFLITEAGRAALAANDGNG